MDSNTVSDPYNENVSQHDIDAFPDAFPDTFSDAFSDAFPDGSGDHDGEINYISNSDDDNCDEILDCGLSSDLLAYDLRNWANEFNISLLAINKLALILNRKTCIALPKDARTLKKTDTTLETRIMDTGYFQYYGLKNQITKAFKSLNSFYISDTLKISLNVDGKQIGNNSNNTLWPILISVNTKPSFILTIGCYFGQSKPSNPESFINDFVEEFLSIQESGILINSKKVNLFLENIIADAPARAFICQTKSHNFKFGCHRCLSQAVCIDHRMVYKDVDNLRMRESIGIAADENKAFFTGVSPLTKLGFDLINNVPFEPMHQIYLGACRILLLKLIEPGKFKLDKNSFGKLEQYISLINLTTPMEFQRKLSCFLQISKWKATEFRHFLLYVGPFALRNVCDKYMYKLFMQLSTSVRILSSKDLVKCASHLEYAKKLLISFVKNFQRFIGIEYCTYNIHSLVHIADDVIKFGNLENFSAFKFENHLRKLSDFIRPCGKQLQQLGRRLSERETLSYAIFDQVHIVKFKKEYSSFRTPLNLNHARFFSHVTNECYTFQINGKDQFALTEDDRYCKIRAVCVIDEKISLIVSYFTLCEDYLTYPVSLKDLFNISKVDALSDEHCIIKLHQITKKCYPIKYEGNLNLVPLIH